MSVKWTLRGTSQCPRYQKSYSNAWKPKNCSKCDFEIGGRHVPKAKRVKSDCPQPVVIVKSPEMNIYSVKLTPWENRIFVMKSTTGDSVCHHKKCKKNRAVHRISPVSTYLLWKNLWSISLQKISVSRYLIVQVWCIYQESAVWTVDSIWGFSSPGSNFGRILCSLHQPLTKQSDWVLSLWETFLW